MSEPFLGEIRVMSFTFAPRGWAMCNGQLLPINQNQALYSILGTVYGGDGRVTFGLPDLRGRLPLGTDFGGHPLGERAGTETVALIPAQIPSHLHEMNAVRVAGDDVYPGLLATAPNLYGPYQNMTQLGAAAPKGPSIAPAGAEPHSNLMPYGVLNFCIALQGIFPSQN